MKNLKLSLAAALALALSACSGLSPQVADFGAMKNGVQISAEEMDLFTDGKSTSAAVLAKFGEPTRKSQTGAAVSWHYEFTQIGQAIIGRNISETAVFSFNPKGILISHSKTKGAEGRSSNALLKAAGM